MTKPHRQRYGLGSFIKKAARKVKKIAKSPLGKAAIIGGLGMIPFGTTGATGWGRLGSMLGAGGGGIGGLWNKLAGSGLGKWVGGLGTGQKILGGLGLAAVATPFIQKLMKTGPYKEEEEESDWSMQPASMANLMGEARDYYQNYDPASSRLAFMPGKEYVNPTFYSAKGGIAKLANGGGAANAQAEQMLKMEYQKYRNQGGTMSYQQFKMAVLKQAQGQGPMAQGQQVPQMAAKGGIMDLGGMEKDYR